MIGTARKSDEWEAGVKVKQDESVPEQPLGEWGCAQHYILR